MRSLLWGLALGGVVSLVAGGAARAQNPGITLKVDDLDLSGILTRLSDMAKTPLELGSRPDAGPQRGSFNWERVSLGQALRDLCKRFELTIYRRPEGGYRLQQLFGGPAPHAGEEKAPRGATPEGFEILVQQVYLNHGRSKVFVGPGNDWEYASLNFQLLCRIPAGEESHLAGLRNVQAEDDLGNKLTSQDGGGFYGSASQFPDEQTVGVQFSTWDPRATRLRWLTGDLVAYASRRQIQIPVSLPLEKRVVVRGAEELLIAVADWRPAEPLPDLPPELQGFGATGGPSVRIRVQWPMGETLKTADGSEGLPAPLVVGASGRRYSGYSSGWSGGGGNGFQFREGQVTFQGMQEQAVRLEWDLVLCSEPERVATVRITDIPLPALPRRQPPAVNPPPAVRPRPPAVRTGSLVSPVVVDGKPAGPGRLSVGLAARRGAGWGPIRWQEVRIGADGEARLPEVPPGTYRVLRRCALPGGVKGRWTNADVTATVVPGKEARLPPLTFVPSTD